MTLADPRTVDWGGPAPVPAWTISYRVTVADGSVIVYDGDGLGNWWVREVPDRHPFLWRPR